MQLNAISGRNARNQITSTRLKCWLYDTLCLRKIDKRAARNQITNTHLKRWLYDTLCLREIDKHATECTRKEIKLRNRFPSCTSSDTVDVCVVYAKNDAGASELVSQLVGYLCPVNHKELYRG